MSKLKFSVRTAHPSDATRLEKANYLEIDESTEKCQINGSILLQSLPMTMSGSPGEVGGEDRIEISAHPYMYGLPKEVFVFYSANLADLRKFLTANEPDNRKKSGSKTTEPKMFYLEMYPNLGSSAILVAYPSDSPPSIPEDIRIALLNKGLEEDTKVLGPLSYYDVDVDLSVAVGFLCSAISKTDYVSIVYSIGLHVLKRSKFTTTVKSSGSLYAKFGSECCRTIKAADALYIAYLFGFWVMCGVLPAGIAEPAYFAKPNARLGAISANFSILMPDLTAEECFAADKTSKLKRLYCTSKTSWERIHSVIKTYHMEEIVTWALGPGDHGTDPDDPTMNLGNIAALVLSDPHKWVSIINGWDISSKILLVSTVPPTKPEYEEFNRLLTAVKTPGTDVIDQVKMYLCRPKELIQRRFPHLVTAFQRYMERIVGAKNFQITQFDRTIIEPSTSFLIDVWVETFAYSCCPAIVVPEQEALERAGVEPGMARMYRSLVTKAFEEHKQDVVSGLQGGLMTDK